ncbi:methionyl-tRNA formyltransferase [candidate division KSB1 bacterium]|nr:methionyl-tRNA formyltransferase [candidate division KSB1 bacterium]
MRIIFMGTPEFAIPSLEILLDSAHEVLAVVTGPDKRVGRGLRLMPTPVKNFAMQQGVPVLTPADLSEQSFIEELKAFHADLFVVVAFRILPEAVFSIPPKGTINLHGSILPKYRGAAPLNWAIINGESETGLTTFYIKKAVDTGDVILTTQVPIGENETAGELHEKMCDIGADLLMKTVDLIERGEVEPVKQQGNATLAPKITKEVCHIDWSKDVRSIYNLIRGLSPYPRAFSLLNNEELKICHAKIDHSFQLRPEDTPGKIVFIDRKGKLLVAAGDGVISIEEIQAQSRCRMSISEFLRGRHVDVGSILN